MTDISIRKIGHAGRITLQRPKALNALTYDMCIQVYQALKAWRKDPEVSLIVMDAEGEKAFCAGGDITQMYDTGTKGDYEFGRKFWADEYRMNDLISAYPKPIVSFLQGYTMGGGVGIGCLGSHRVVGDGSQIAMPECGIGLVPDVGGTFILCNAPGRLGEYLGTTGARMNAGDAIAVGFADGFVPEAEWAPLIEALEATGDVEILEQAYRDAPDAPLLALQPEIDKHFAGESLGDIVNSLESDGGEFAQDALKLLGRSAPLSMACAVEMIHRLRGPMASMRKALDMEYRFTYRAMEHGDFIEGIRAQVIDKDRNPNWQHELSKVPAVAVSKMLIPLGKNALTFEEEDSMKIGFIGLGNMGGPMAANLAKAGYTVAGFDMADVSIEGVTNVANGAEAAKNADVVITMLPNGAILRSVANEVIPAMKSGAVLLDCSTVDVESARDVANQANEADLSSLDAPVSGGVGGATAGTLTFMVGGDQKGFETALPLFDVMGQKAVHCGPSGNGQAAKICNNMILGITMIGTCEAFALADKLGLDRQAMFDVVSTSSGYSWTMNAYCPAPGIGPQSPADNNYQPGFASELMLKDLRLSQQAAEAADADTPMGQAATALYEQFVENEDGLGMDFSAMLPRFEKRGRE